MFHRLGPVLYLGVGIIYYGCYGRCVYSLNVHSTRLLHLYNILELRYENQGKQNEFNCSCWSSINDTSNGFLFFKNLSISNQRLPHWFMLILHIPLHFRLLLWCISFYWKISKLRKMIQYCRHTSCFIQAYVACSYERACICDCNEHFTLIDQSHMLVFEIWCHSYWMVCISMVCAFSLCCCCCCCFSSLTISQSHSFCRYMLDYCYFESLLTLTFDNKREKNDHWNSELYFNDWVQTNPPDNQIISLQWHWCCCMYSL